MLNSIILKNVTVAYDRHPAVHHISGSFASGSMTAILGPNGAGKSTLLKAIAGIIKPSDGKIQINSQSGGKIAYLPQSSQINSEFPLSAWQTVMLGFWAENKYLRKATIAQAKKADQALDIVGMQPFAGRKLSTLSTGQLQRILFARIIAQDSEIILLDEPFSALDTETTTSLLNVLSEWHKEGRTIICILHDIEQIRAYFPECLLISRECISWGNTAEALQVKNLVRARMLYPIWNEKAEVCNIK